MVFGVGDVDVSRRVGGDSVRGGELTGIADEALPAELEVAAFVEPLDAIPDIRDVDVAIGADRYAERLGELTVQSAGDAPAAEVVAVAAEHLDPVVPVVGDVDQTRIEDRDPARDPELAAAAAGAAPFGDEDVAGFGADAVPTRHRPGTGGAAGAAMLSVASELDASAVALVAALLAPAFLVLALRPGAAVLVFAALLADLFAGGGSHSGGAPEQRQRQTGGQPAEQPPARQTARHRPRNRVDRRLVHRPASVGIRSA